MGDDGGHVIIVHQDARHPPCRCRAFLLPQVAEVTHVTRNSLDIVPVAPDITYRFSQHLGGFAMSKNTNRRFEQPRDEYATVLLTRDEKRAVEDLAAADDRSISYVIRQAILAFIDAEVTK